MFEHNFFFLFFNQNTLEEIMTIEIDVGGESVGLDLVNQTTSSYPVGRLGMHGVDAIGLELIIFNQTNKTNMQEALMDHFSSLIFELRKHYSYGVLTSTTNLSYRDHEILMKLYIKVKQQIQDSARIFFSYFIVKCKQLTSNSGDTFAVDVQEFQRFMFMYSLCYDTYLTRVHILPSYVKY